MLTDEITKTISQLKITQIKSDKRIELLKKKQANLRYVLLDVMTKIEVLRCRNVPLDSREYK